MLVALAGCTANDGRSAPAPESARPSVSASPADPTVRRLVTAFVGCLRAADVETGNPSIDDSGYVSRWPRFDPSPVFEPAINRCRREIVELAYEPRGEAAVFFERAQRFAACMKKEGIKDIEVSDQGIMIGPGSRNRDIRAAERKCRPLMEGS